MNDKNESALNLDEVVANPVKMFNAAVVIDPLQVVELGQYRAELYSKLLQNFSKVLIVVPVSSAGLDRNEFLDYPTRVAMVMDEFGAHPMSPNNIKLNIIPMPDMPTPKKWSEVLEARIREVLPMERVVILQGAPAAIRGDDDIRHYFGKIKSVEASGYLFNDLSEAKVVSASAEFRRGMLYFALQTYKRINPTIDVAIIDYDRKLILLGRKPNETQYRFIGGHYEAKDGSYRVGGKREAFEESGGLEVGALEYVTDGNVNDWRYPNSTNQICTVLFAAPYMSGRPSTDTDDLEEVRWFKVGHHVNGGDSSLSFIQQDTMIEEHRKFFDNGLKQFLAEFSRHSLDAAKNFHDTTTIQGAKL